MRMVVKTEATKWLSLRGLADIKGRHVLDKFARKETYPIPPDSGKKTVIARELAYHFGRFSDGILWIDEFGIWPSAENWYLFDAFRQSLGERRPLHESPGHIFTPGDTDAVFALLSMVLYFGWGAILAPSSGELVVRISHDGFIDIYARDSYGLGNELFDTLARIVGDKPV